MQIVPILTIAKTVWLERARRRPHTAIAWFMCAVIAATIGACALYGSSPFADTVAGERIARCLFVIAAGASLTYLCEWLIGLHFHGSASAFARDFWSWRGVGQGVRRSIPRGHLALIVFTAVVAWAQSRMIGVLLSMLLLYCSGLYVVLHQLALSQFHRKLYAKFNREIVSSTCDIVMTPLLASLGFLLGSVLILGAALTPAVILLYWSGERLTVLRSMRRPQPAQQASVLRRMVPGIAVLGVDGLLHGLSMLVSHGANAAADPFIGVIVATVLFVSAGVCAARRFTSAGRDQSTVFALPRNWWPAIGLAAGSTLAALLVTVLITTVTEVFLSKIPILNYVGYALSAAAVIVASLFSVVVNTEPYPILCDPPSDITIVPATAAHTANILQSDASSGN